MGEYWDNNGTFNYQVDFAKKPKVQHGKNGMPGLGARPLNALPRSRPSPPTSSGRPKSMPTSFDDFSTGFDNFGSFGQSAGSLMGEPRLLFRSSVAIAGVIRISLSLTFATNIRNTNPYCHPGLIIFFFQLQFLQSLGASSLLALAYAHNARIDAALTGLMSDMLNVLMYHSGRWFMRNTMHATPT